MKIKVKFRNDKNFVLKMNCHALNGKILDVYDVEDVTQGIYKGEKRYWLLPSYPSNGE